VGIIGRLTAIKDHRFFLDAFREAALLSGAALKAIVIGDGEEMSALQAHCRSLDLAFAAPGEPGADARVVFTSWIREIDRAVAGLDIVAMTSLNEGTPVSLIEAQAGGKAVVSTAAGGTADVVQHGVTGLLSAVGDRAAFTGNLVRLVSDPALRERLGVSGRAHATERFHVTRLVADMRRLYRNLLSSRA
jgi:glycosyltransferase involved in cell wall biosynthesis